MARIRSIKPELPQSESMGNVSRDARLTFILLWTLSDDFGRLRGNSRMLASLLFPYDDDAPKLIDEWLLELENEKCIVRYEAEDARYIQILNWDKHQKVDKPTASKIPQFDESSRILASESRILPVGSKDLDQGSEEGIKDQGSGEEARVAHSAPPAPKRATRFRPPEDKIIPADWAAFSAKEMGWTSEQAQKVFNKFTDHWIAESGAKATKSDWLATWRNWCRNEKGNNQGQRYDQRTQPTKQNNISAGLAVLAESYDRQRREDELGAYWEHHSPGTG